MQYVKIAYALWSFRREIGTIAVILIVLTALPMMVAIGMIVKAGATPGTTIDTHAQLYTGPVSKLDTYDFGYCTFWAAERRIETGKPIPNDWGNANTWAIRAQAVGYLVDNTPSVGAVMQTTAGALGHVAFVEGVKADGSWIISEMNAPKWDFVDERTLPASQAANYSFIH